jgi:DNA-binding winged helix-turn-helix (wHTH) protein/dipeptidyl aminopeptidase/acylaminoacyl peptidase
MKVPKLATEREVPPTTLQAGSYEFGPFRLDPATRQLSRNSLPIPVTPKVFDLLRVFLTHPGRVLEKGELMQLVWPDTFVGEDSLTQHVAALRRALGDAPEHPQYVATVPKHGYRFVAAVREIPPERAESPVQPGAEPAPTAPAELQPAPAAEPVATQIQPDVWRKRLPIRLLVGAMLLLVASAAFLGYRQTPEPAARLVRFTVGLPEATTLLSSGVVSPDGTHIAFVARDPSGRTRLWVRAIDSVDAWSLPQTEGATVPFWSPDNDAVGYFADGRLKVVSLAGGPPRVVAPVTGTPLGGAWSREGVIVFGQGRVGIFSVPISGGVPTPVTSPDRSAQETNHGWPQVLPDGVHFLYYVRSATSEARGTFLGALGSTMKRRVLDSLSSAAVYAAGQLFFVRDRTLMAQSFDLRTFQVTGAPEPVAGGVPPPDSRTNGVTFSASSEGTLAYLSDVRPGRLIWFDRAGAARGTIDGPVEFGDVALSPDEQYFAGTDLTDTSDAGIWLFDLRRGVASQLSTIGAWPIWAPDGRRLAFSSSAAAGILDLYQKPPFGDDRAELMFSDGRSVTALDWSRDGRFVLVGRTGGGTRADLWLLPDAGEGEPIPYLTTPFAELQARISPDGRWVAYTSDESGIWEVYVQSFPVPGGKRTISTQGGGQPQWRGDGRELFYVASDRQLMAVEIRIGADGTLDAGIPAPLFDAQVPHNLVGPRNDYAVTHDGRRFLVGTDKERGAITIVLNWRRGSTDVSARTASARAGSR